LEETLSEVWLTIPSKKPAPEAQVVIDRWRARGYRAAIWRDAGDAPVDCDLLLTGEYPGYARAVNALALEAVKRGAEWCVVAGDDIDPDPTHDPSQVAFECGRHFGEEQRVYRMEPTLHSTLGPHDGRFPWSTFGVMQPTGDRWGADRNDKNFCGSAYADRVCGSAWYGAEYVRRMYGGAGPLWPGWFHMYSDEEGQEVAILMGVLWQRRELTQMHNHWGRTTGRMPDYLKRANAEFSAARELFAQRKAAGFPGHHPCAS
jgi:hypothetical protein